MNQKASKLAEKVSDDLDQIADAAQQLKEAIENDDEEKIEAALSVFPTPKQMAASFSKLGVLLETRPWEKRSKHA